MDNMHGISGTEIFRRHAVWLLPFFLAFHAMLTFGISACVGNISLIAAAIALVVGLGLRWCVKRTTTLLSIMIALGVFVFFYVGGIVGPISYLFVTENGELAPLVALLNSLIIGGFFIWRLRVSFREDWSGPIEHGPGVLINSKANTLDRISSSNLTPFSKVLVVVGFCSLLATFLLRNASWYLASAAFVGPIVIAILLTDGIARLVTFYWVFRRWEQEHGVHYRLPELSSRKRR